MKGPGPKRRLFISPHRCCPTRRARPAPGLLLLVEPGVSGLSWSGIQRGRRLITDTETADAGTWSNRQPAAELSADCLLRRPCSTKCGYITENGFIESQTNKFRRLERLWDRIQSLEIIAVGSEVISPVQMIIPTNWVSPFFIILGACMILATITCCLFHLRKNRNQKKEITDWINAVKHGRVVYHPLLHWIKNNSDFSIKTKEYSSDNEECKKRKIWKAQNVLPPRYKKKSRNSGAFNHKAGYFNSPRIGNKSFPKSSVNVASGEASWIHSQPNKEKAKYFSFPNITKPFKVLPTSPSLEESFANIHKCEMELDEKQPDVVSSKKRESFGSPIKQKH